MSLYAPEDERRIRSQALVREWTKSALLDPSQGAALEAELRVDVRRTNVFLRAGLALFTMLIVAASVMLFILAFELRSQISWAVTTTVSAVVCWWLAEYLVVRQRFYRFGVEEALATGAAVLMAAGAFAIDGQEGLGQTAAPLVGFLLVCAAGGLGLHWRFGYVYGAFLALACVATVPFRLDMAPTLQHAQAAATLAGAVVLARARRTRYRDDHRGEDYALVQAAAWAGLYFTLNLWVLKLLFDSPFFSWSARLVDDRFYWFSYMMIWFLPLAGLSLAIRDKDRPLLGVSLVTALVTLLTNKSYLGWPRHAWDPILLGVFAMAAAITVRRWLSRGANGQRAGFTPVRILSKDAGAVTMLGTASAGFDREPPSHPESDRSGFDGGRSGGGGASGSY